MNYFLRKVFVIMNRRNLAVIGVGNMAKAIINGIKSSDFDLSKINLFDIKKEQYTSLLSEKISAYASIEEAVSASDCVLLSVKPQNYDEVLTVIKRVKDYQSKLYISIGAGISTSYISDFLGDAAVVRVLPNLPMVIGSGVSVICRNRKISDGDFSFVKRIFCSSGSVMEIEEDEMNRIIGVTSSSPAYVFKFIDAICQGARAQGIEADDILDAVCDMVIGSALMLKNSKESPSELISRVASKGGTTERALLKLDEYKFSEGIESAMKACTVRANELGANK